MASITVSSEGVDQKYPLENPSVTLGRGLESDIRLKDIKASRRHCQIVKTPKGFQCVDLSSGNGTFLNGVQINKQQMLAPGDKIQIGSTTITFEEAEAAKPAPAAKPKSASATAALPKVQAPAAKTTQSAKVATAQIPIAQTRRITSRIDTVKPSTQSIPKAGSTAAMKKTTQRGGGSGATTRGLAVSATQKFKAEGRRKKANPMVILLGTIGVVFVVVITLILFWPKDTSDLVRSQLEGFMKKAVELDSQDKYDAAIAEFKKALELCVGDKWKGQAAEIKAQIRATEENKNLKAGATQKWADYKARVDKSTNKEANELLQEGKRMKEAYGNANVPWLVDLGKQIEILQKMIDTQIQIDKRSNFQFRRQEITEKHKLGAKDGSAHYSNAIREWKDFLAGSASSDEKTKAQGELNNINVRAKEAVGTLRTRSTNLKDSGKKDEAVEMVKKDRTRFELTDVYSEYEKVLAEIQK